jgi:hypothetical protein
MRSLFKELWWKKTASRTNSSGLVLMMEANLSSAKDLRIKMGLRE